ncbi:MAG: septum formation inhibitor Maf [Oceanospirillaceae bacterium]|nr:septum formation inhibitor Maf [Oceanospirillaceae bacterium]MBT10516.1 septum formation inhibitor Maf [Oceanospirillaceae bacterium]|tara:strand:+ start:94985 stop:95569 length:585 start_codon:yes stop_codon:yes gene_type:complete
MKLLLASGSAYRRALLNRLRIPFDCASPDIDETPHPGEEAQQYVVRLAREKARALAGDYPHHWIIGSDQTCVLNNRICGKPHTEEKAIEQLSASSGQQVTFYTGLCLRSPQGEEYFLCEPFSVYFRPLQEEEIRHYVALEQPLDCAGSFKAEGLGISLFEKMEGRDMNSLIGLPMIALTELMRQAGINPLLQAT